MDKMSLLSILTVSVPEAIFNIYFGFLVTGEKVHLYLDDKLNIIRLFIAVTFMVLSSVTVRYLLPNLLLVLLVNMVFYTIILKFVYKLKWSKSSVTVIIFVTFLITIESIYFLPVMALFSVSKETVFNYDLWRIIYSLPERFIQLFTVISIWNVNSVFFNIKGYKKIQTPFFGLAITLLATEAAFAFIFMNIADQMEVKIKFIYLVALFLFSVINFLLLRFITYLANAIMKNDVDELIEYKKKVHKRLSDIHKYIDDGDINSAKEISKKGIYN